MTGDTEGGEGCQDRRLETPVAVLGDTRELDGPWPDPGEGRELDAQLEELMPSVVRYLRWRGSTPADADDLCQEVMIRAWHGRTSFRGQGPLKAWVLGIAFNVKREHNRHLGRLMRGLQSLMDRGWVRLHELPHQEASDPERQAHVRMSLHRLEVVLRTLEAGCAAEAFWLREVEDLGFKEVGEILGVTTNKAYYGWSVAKKHVDAAFAESDAKDTLEVTL